MQESASYEARNVMCNAVSLGLCLGSTKCRGDKFACMGGGVLGGSQVCLIVCWLAFPGWEQGKTLTRY